MLDEENFSDSHIGKYRIMKELASSSSSRIFLTRPDFPDQAPMVIQLFYTASIDTPGKRARFLAEMRLLSQLQHPFILPIVNVGIDKGTPYTVLPYLPSGSLYDRMQKNTIQPLTTERAVILLLQIGQALQYAHEHHIFHGKLKPRNILLQEDGRVQLSDFTCMTTQKAINGSYLTNSDTMRYRDPEQAEVGNALSDQYALGCLAYELLTGHKPFKPLFPGSRQKEGPAAPTQWNPRLSQHIEHVLLKAIAERPEQRFPDVLTFVDTLIASAHLPALVTPALPVTFSPSSYSGERTFSSRSAASQETLPIRVLEPGFVVRSLEPHGIAGGPGRPFMMVPRDAHRSVKTGRKRLRIFLLVFLLIMLFAILTFGVFVYTHMNGKMLEGKVSLAISGVHRVSNSNNASAGTRVFQVGGHVLLVIKGHRSDITIHSGNVGSVMVATRQYGSKLPLDPNSPGIFYSQLRDGQGQDHIGIATEPGLDVDYDVTVPSTAQIQVQVDIGSVAVAGVSGVTIETGNGNLDVENIQGPVDIHTINGDVTAGNIKGQMTMMSVNGTIRVNNVNGSLNAITSSGDVNVMSSLLNGTSMLVTNAGSVSFAGTIDPLGSYTLKTSRGNVNLTLPGNAAFQLNASTGSGSVQNAFGGTIIGKAPRAQVTITIDFGTIVVNKAV